MSNYISSALTGKLARRALKDAFGKKYPDVKFSVRTDNSMNVSWTDGPLASEVDSVVSQFTGATFDGMQDLESSVHSRWSKKHAKWAKGLKNVPVLSVGDDVWFSTKYVFTRRDISREYIESALPVVCDILKNCYEKYDVKPSDYEVVTSDYGSTSVKCIGHGYNSEPRFQGHYIDARSYNVHSMTMNEMINEYTHARTMADLIPATVAEVTEVTETIESTESIEGVTIRFNDAKQGIEVLFSAKPSESVRAQLKAAKFRWSRNQGLWYAKDTQESRALAFSFQVPSIESIQAETAEQLNQSVPDTVPVVDSDPGLEILDYEVEQERKRLATAEKLEGLADRMQATINDKFRSRPTHTHRMRANAASMASDGECLQEVQSALRAIAWATRRETLDEKLKNLTSKKAVSEVVDNIRWMRNSSRASLSYDKTSVCESLSQLVESFNRRNNEPVPSATSDAQNALYRRIQESTIACSGIPGFFPTPDALADEVVKKADVQPHHTVCNTSAGWGSLLAAAKRAGVPSENIDAVEISYTLFQILEQRGFNVIGRDCLEMTTPTRQYDRLLLNPAFENGHAAKEIKHGYLNFLKDGGVLAAIVPSIVMNGDNYLKFREWAVSESNATFERLPDNSFAGIDSARRTGVGTALVILRKGAQPVTQAATVEPKWEPVSLADEVYQYMIF